MYIPIKGEPIQFVGTVDGNRSRHGYQFVGIIDDDDDCAVNLIAQHGIPIPCSIYVQDLEDVIQGLQEVIGLLDVAWERHLAGKGKPIE